MTGPESKVPHLAFIAFQHPFHVDGKAVIVLCQMLLTRFLPLIPGLGKQLGPSKVRIPAD